MAAVNLRCNSLTPHEPTVKIEVMSKIKNSLVEFPENGDTPYPAHTKYFGLKLAHWRRF